MSKLKRSNGIVTEKAHLNTNVKNFNEGFDRIFGKKSNEMEILPNHQYRNLKNNQVYIVVGFITDCDTDKEKVLYKLSIEKENKLYTRLPERFRQKFNKVKTEE